MTSNERFLSETLAHTARLVILGVGSELMADDGAGVMITDALIGRFGSLASDKLLILSGGNAPECFTGVIKVFDPDHVMLIDAADFNGGPGECRGIDPAEVSGVSFSTHMLPLKVMLDYLRKEVNCRVTILGIQPKRLEFCGEMSEEVGETANELIGILARRIDSICIGGQ